MSPTSGSDDIKSKRSSLAGAYPLYLAGRAQSPNQDLTVHDKYTGEVATHVALASDLLIDEAIGAAASAFDAFSRWPSHRRQAVLKHLHDRMEERREEFATALTIEVGKPITESRGEVARALETIKLSMEEATRIGGEVIPLDISPMSENYHGFWKRVPVGPCSFISPFNFPLNLVAHKIAPALAVGCSFVLKPASTTPLSALMVGEILAETDLPEGTFSILPCARDAADLFTTDERCKLLSFTGSPDVGWALKARAGKKKVILELGGNAACIVDEGVDVADAVGRILIGGFTHAGQSCISVQRIFVHADLHEELRDGLLARVDELRVGDPLDESVRLGPLISEKEARRVESWVDAAVAGGARLFAGGKRSGSFYEPTVVENVPKGCDLRDREVFGPVVCLEPFEDFDAALDLVNDSAYGLQAGVFTRDMDRAFRAHERLDVGGVVINDVPSMRVDAMPYGGVKDSGIGREGPRYSMEDMTEMRMMLVRRG